LQQSEPILAGAAPPPPQAGAGAQVLARSELLESLGGLRTLCREYRTLHERAWDEAPGEDTRALLARHRRQARDAAGPFAALAPAGALLGFVAHRLRLSWLTFHLPGRAPLPPAEGETGLGAYAARLREVLPPLDALTARVYALAEAAPELGGARMRRVLYPAAALFKAIVRQDWADAELVLHHLNMVTTSRDNHELMEQIGRLVRGIYDSLNDISRELPVASLSSVSEEIPDAVQKLGTVIAELEAGANRNLDLLELLSARKAEGGALVEAAGAALARCDEELAALAAAHPAAAPALDALRAELQGGAAEPLAGWPARGAQCHDVYMQLFSSQSYQDLTGQTLKKVIAFIESLQYQLIQVISKGSGIPTAAAAAPREASTEAGPDAHNRLSQDRVDSMLAELGF
jgi:chemotaxis protein CheZ